MSAWSRSLYLDLAQLAACQAIAVNEAAGGAATFKATNDYKNSMDTIVCQLMAANEALGAAAVCPMLQIGSAKKSRARNPSTNGSNTKVEGVER